MGERDPVFVLLRELLLAGGMIAIIVLAMWAHTGSMPPLVVVESNSMQHDENGEYGTIDAGDLILVHNKDSKKIVTFVEAKDKSNPNYGYESLGMAGDVIIFERNGEEESTPIIHRAMFDVLIANSTGQNENQQCDEGTLWDEICILSWTVPGTDQINVGKINLRFDGNQTAKYHCDGYAAMHGENYYHIENYTPTNPGYITLGDNNNCNDDQGVFAFAEGITSMHSGIVRPVLYDWVIGVSGEEIPWLGTVKLLVSGGDSPGASQVPGMSFFYLVTFILIVLAIPVLVDPLINRTLRNSPEMIEAEHEDALAAIYGKEEE